MKDNSFDASVMQECRTQRMFARNAAGLIMGTGALLTALFFVSGCASSRLPGIDDIDRSATAAGEQDARARSVGAGEPEAPSPEPTIASRGRSKRKAAPGEVTIQPECILEIKVKEDPALNGDYVVNEISAIDFGYVGLVILRNMAAAEASAEIRFILESRYFREANVSVAIRKASYDRIQVDGEVMRPGVQKIAAGATISLNDALLGAGGLRPQAKGAKIKIVKGGLLSPFRSASEGEILSLVTEDGKVRVPDVTLRNNDLVYVSGGEKQAVDDMGEKEVIVIGEVARPGPVRFASNEPCTLMHLIFKIGGLPKWANTRGIRIVRTDQVGNKKETPVDASKVLRTGAPEDDVPLENGDRIIVPTRRFAPW